MKKYLILKKALFIIIGLMAIFVIMPFMNMNDTAFAMTNTACWSCHGCTPNYCGYSGNPNVDEIKGKHHLYYYYDDACKMCHNSSYWNNDCVACHTSGKVCNSTISNHSDCKLAAHNNVPVDPGCQSAQCHGTNVVTEHFKYRGTYGGLTCGLCHQLPGFINTYNKQTNVVDTIAKGSGVNGQTVSCRDCHGTAADHLAAHDHAKIDDPVTCTKCHNSNVVTEHANRGLGCNVCHSSADPNVIYVINIGKGPIGQDVFCRDCHGVTDHAAAHDHAKIDSEDCLQCHAINVVTEHANRNLGCNVCHSSTDQKVIDAINKGKGTDGKDVFCTDCHIVHANDAPHNASNTMACLDCHQNSTVPTDDTCSDCHLNKSGGAYSKNSAPWVATHSSTTTGSTKYTWTTQCMDCHGVHLQEQRAYLGSGTITSVTDNGKTTNGNTTTFGYSNFEAQKPEWADRAKWGKKAGNERGLIIYPNESNPSISFEILSATDNTITTTGSISEFGGTSAIPSNSTFVLTYGQNVRANLQYPTTAKPAGTVPVRFFDKTGPNSFADGDTPYDGICEVCHNMTDHFRNAAGAPDPNHANIGSGIPGTNCISCHTHPEGFKASCNACHGFPPIVNSATSPDGLVWILPKTGSATAGAHNLHVNEKSYQCDTCHYQNITQNNHNKDPRVITLGFYMFSGAYRGGSYDGQYGLNYNTTNTTPVTTVANSGAKTCSNLYCHGGTMAPNGGTASAKWDVPASADCGTCHGATAAAPPQRGSHPKHAGSASGGIQLACTVCHSSYTSVHINGSANWAYDTTTYPWLSGALYRGSASGSASPVPSASYGTCSNLYCHSQGTRNASPHLDPNIAAIWGRALNAACTGCHSGDKNAPNMMNTGSHTKHVVGSGIDCSKCHNATATNSRTIGNDANHVNRLVNVAYDSASNPGGNATYNGSVSPMTKTPGTEYGSCSNVYCHGSGIPVWGGTNPTTDCTWCHGGNATSVPPVATGEHTPHINNTAVLGTNYECAECHSTTVSPGNDRLITGTAHSNGIKDIAMLKGGTWNSGTKTCTTVYCHSSGKGLYLTVHWGSTPLGCNGCHGTSTTTGAPNYPNGGPGTLTANSHPKHTTAGSSSCDACHTNTVATSGTAIKAGSTLHTNQIIEVTFNTAKVGTGTWTAATKTCSNISCHGSGTPKWGGTVSCQSCHLGPADVDNFTGTFWNNGIAGVISSSEWSSTGHGNPAAAFTSSNACTYCHDDSVGHNYGTNPFRLRNIADATWGKNGNCQLCHATGSAGVTVDGLQKNGARKIDSTHYGVKHGTSNNGGQFCWDCHDPHGDNNVFMIHKSVAKTSDAATGAPTNPVATTFTASATGTDYAKSTSPFDGVCNVCHTNTMHYTSTSGDGHMSNTRCTNCHNHTGKTTTDAFGVDCISCHSTVQGNRAAVASQFSGNSHHIQGVTLTNAHCYECHWEANSDGSVNSQYHGGTSTSPVDLVIYGSGTRPTAYTAGTTAIEYTAGATPPPVTEPGVVNVVDTWRQLSTSGSGSSRTASFTAGSGTSGNRMVIIGMAWEDSHWSGCNPSAITGNYGGQTITTINKAIASNNREGQWMGYIGEAGIAARSNNTITLTFSGCTPDRTPTISVATYEEVAQASAPASAIASGTTGSSFSWSGLPVVSGGYAMYNVNADGISSFTPPSTYTERYDVATSNFRMSAGDKAITVDGTESRTVTGNTSYSSYSSSGWALVAVSLKPANVGVSGGREIEKINQHCLSCHSAQNNTAQPFGDGKTPKQYAWDGTSVDERYSQTGTTPWSKYSGANTTPKNTQTKAYSAHGNAANNQRGWDLNETWPNKSGSVRVACFDCHNSHGSTVSGTTTSYDKPEDVTTNHGILKDTTAGKGGYAMSYKPQQGGSASDKNAYNPGAGLCFDCHMTQNSGTTPWGYQGTFGATQAIMSYNDTQYFGPGIFGYQQRYAYKAAMSMKGGHFGASATLATPANGTIGGVCTPCHDPHGVSASLGTNLQYGVPLLKGTWMTSPYKEDAAPLATNEKRGGGKDGEYVHSDASTPNYHIDQNTFNTTWSWSSTTRVTQTDDQFGGLCLKCHVRADINSNADKSWRSMDRIHNTVKDWADGTYSGTNNSNAVHSFTCSKCHAPHNSSLNRLMVTNCLDYTHRGRVASGGIIPKKHSRRGDEGQGAGQFPGGGGGRGDEEGSRYRGPWFFGTSSSPYIRVCHDNTNTDSYPANQRWNTKTPW